MRKIFSSFIMSLVLFSSVYAEDSVAQNSAENSISQNAKASDEEILNIEDTENQTRHPSWVGWVFGATDVSIDVYSASNISALSTITFSFGPRFNFNKMSASTISDEGFSIAGRLGLGVSAIDNFHTTGFAMPIELEASYTIGEFTASAGLSFLIIPSLENLKDFTNVGIYADLGWARGFGAMSLRLGYIFHSTATIEAFGRQQFEYKPLDGSFNFGVRWQL